MSTVTHSTAAAVFANRVDADRAVDALMNAGFTSSQIGVAARDAAGNVSKTDANAEAVAAEGAGSGAIAGAAAGAGIGGLIGLGVLAGVIPVIGPAIAAGTLATILTNVAAGAGVVGLTGALLGAGMPENEAKYYESEFKGNKTLVTVNASNRFAEAQRILDSHGGSSYSRTVR